ncbi:hypothetical protein K438DRAFT_1998373 [Mycena galopus ATCC 62051]|nr:hypothetical protein K438DRAFT_1998373 [Mycena galopus ATCC 62051]
MVYAQVAEPPERFARICEFGIAGTNVNGSANSSLWGVGGKALQREREVNSPNHTLSTHALHARILFWFDAPAAPFGVHRMALASKTAPGAGVWLVPAALRRGHPGGVFSIFIATPWNLRSIFLNIRSNTIFAIFCSFFRGTLPSSIYYISFPPYGALR